ncbi:MAG: hypothetical protein D6728_18650 [Cyanobacteria bacterium J055]|nr:MAG: hypothetical protein D6728_18650 [Cyanobacteria bacterium J055]
MKSPIPLFLVALILVAVVGQNLSPSLPLVLLGIRLIALPVGVWVALAIALGMVTAGVISCLFPRSRGIRPDRSRPGHSSPPPSPPRDPERVREATTHPVSPQTAYAPPSRPLEETDEIEVEYASVQPSPLADSTRASQSSEEEIWDDEEWELKAEPTNGTVKPPESEEEKRRVVEVHKDPIASDLQGTIYSYTYRSPEEERKAAADAADDETDEETTDFQDIPPEPPIDPFPQLEIIDPILEPEPPRTPHPGAVPFKTDRSAAKPPPQTSTEDDWGESANSEEEDW